MIGVQDELFRIGWLAADVLKRFAEVQNNIRSWRVALFVPVNFSQHERDACAIRECFGELLTRLENVMPHIAPGSKEDDLAQALGHYLCAVTNAVSAYEHLTRLMDYHGKKARFRGAIRVWCARRKFDCEVNDYLEKGVVLQRIWVEMDSAID